MERAVNYCRCSTEEESQRDALQIQTLESREWIKKMGWIQVDEYVEAKSGTQMKGRTEYQRLFEDMAKDKFDIIVIKDQDRLMRNTKDWYLFIDRMLQHGKRLFMYLENKYYTPDDALITGIRAIMAEEYSRHLSKKINNAHRGRQEKGTNVVLNSNTYGFIKEKRQPPIIREKEAEAINRMFDLSILGYGANRISKQLYREGYTDREGRPIPDARIRKIIRNPLYMGTAVMNKRHFDFETKQMLHNPKEEWIVHENIVPAIVSPEKWQQANMAMDERKKQEGALGKTRHQPVLSRRIFCGCCGAPYFRTSRKRKSGIVKEWKCSSYLKNGRIREIGKDKEISPLMGCNNAHLEEDILIQHLEKILTQYYSPQEGKQNFIDAMLGVLKQTLDDPSEDAERKLQEEKQRKRIEKLEHQQEILLDKLLDEVITDEEYQKKKMELQNSISELKGGLEQQQEQELARKKLEQRLEEIRNWMEQGGLEKASAMDMIADIQRIVVYPDYLDIELLPEKISDLSILERHPIHIKTTYPFSWSTKQGRTITEEKLVKLWQENPEMTVKQMGKELGIPYRAVLSRVNHLKAMGKVRYNGKGGNGSWEILEP